MTQTSEPTNALAQRDPLTIARQVFGDERIDVLKEQIGRGWREPMTDAELEHIGLVCQRTRLDPLAKPPQIYFIKRFDSRLRKEVMTPQVSIDGLRLIAQRSREYAGQVGPLFTADGKEWTEVWLSDDPPAAAKVGVLRRGFKEPIWSVATWREWAQWNEEYDRQGNKTGRKVLAPFWLSKPALMLGKTAEALSIKRACPAETNELELAALEEEWKVERIALAAKYQQIMGADERHTVYDLPDARVQPAALAAPAEVVTNASGQGVDVRTGEIVHDLPESERLATATDVQERAEDESPPSSSARPASDDRGDLWAENRSLVARATELGLTGVPTLNTRASTDVLRDANTTLAERIRNLELDQRLQAQQEQESSGERLL